MRNTAEKYREAKSSRNSSGGRSTTMTKRVGGRDKGARSKRSKKR